MTKTKTITVLELTCDRCDHTWQIPADKPLPKTCGKCKSRVWNEGRKKK